MLTPQFILPLADEMIVDLFAGGGGMSTAIERAMGRHVDIAANHDDDATSMHRANHPQTRHFIADVFEVDPRGATKGRPVGLLHLSPDCFPAGTMVLTAHGYRPIEEISIGDLVLTHRGRWRAVTDTMATERELIRVTGHGHPGLTVSAEHPFYARRRHDTWSTSPRGYRATYEPAAWIPATDLGRGWYWATPHAFPDAKAPAVGGRGMEITPDLLWLAGRYLGDGWTRLDDKHAELVITCGKHEVDGLRQLLAKWPAIAGRAGYDELRWQERHTGTAYQFTTAHQGFVEWLREHFGHGAAEKRVPGWALGMPKELREALLSGYVSADGQTTDAFIETQSVSKALAFGVKALAESLGHTVAVYTNLNRNVIEGRAVNVLPIWRCRWRHAVDEAHRQTFRDDLHEWAPVRKTEIGVGHGRVFNLSVEDDESYVVEGIVAHNCTHFSQAKGGQTRNTKIRGLSWVGVRWAGQVRPRVITLENVKQIRQWGPLIAKRDKATGRVVKLDGSVAIPGERVPVQNQFLVPDPKHAGRTWKRFLAVLAGMGYTVDSKILVAADFGAPTTRERLFLQARCDGEPIVWPEATHFKNPGKGQKRWRAAAECIDWSIPCPSIFTRKRPLADATMKRIARGVQRFVIDAAEPFIVPVTQSSNPNSRPVSDPLRTVTTAKGGEFMVAAPHVVPVTHHGKREPIDPCGPLPTVTAAHRGEFMSVSPLLAKFRGSSDGADISQPLPTITSGAGAARPAGCAHAMGVVAPVLIQAAHGEGSGATTRRGLGAHDVKLPVGTVHAGGGSFACATAFLEQANGGFNVTPGHDARRPLTTATHTGSQQRVVAANLAHLRHNCDARDAADPLQTVSAGGLHHGVIECTLSPEHEAGALRVAAFLIRYYGEGGQHGELSQPAATITAKDRLALVTVTIQGQPYVIVDIGLRMLEPRELYMAQGFPADYNITHGHDGRAFSKSKQVRMCGNSVSPPPAEAMLRAISAESRIGSAAA